MKKILRYLLRATVRLLLSLRYRITVKGLEKLEGVKGPLLVLPNHPAYVDPVIVMTHLPGRLALRPLVFEGTFRNPMVRPFVWLIHALEVPDLQSHSQEARKDTDILIDRLAEGLKKGDSFLVYPSGRLQRRGREIVGAARSVSEVLQRLPETKVLLVRTRGLWGSSFGCAQEGGLPNLNKVLMKALGWLLAGGLLFMPRRKVSLRIEEADFSCLSGFEREKLNPFLENYYNQDVCPDPVYVPYHPIIGPRDIEFPPSSEGFDVPLERITDHTRNGVAALLEEKIRRPLKENENQPGFSLEEFGFDSLDRMEIALAIEQRFGFRSDHVATTLGELWALAQGEVPQNSGVPIKASEKWKTTRQDSEIPGIPEDTITKAFLSRAEDLWGEVAVADDTAGALTYGDLVWKARLLSEHFDWPEEEAVGVLLPSSVAADSTFIALLLAGKLPVFLNWTTGPGNLASAVRTMKIRHVVTSKQVIDRFDIKVEGAEYVFLEEIAGRINKLRALLLKVYLSMRKGQLQSLAPGTSPGSPAVVLFTSGSEKAPKAVPLTHHNIISNLRGGIQALKLKRSEVLLGFLPPFHSFGLCGTMILPLISGMRLVHHADPTDSHNLIEKIRAYGVSLLFTTPTFLSNILARSESSHLESLRLVMTGAEKCPPSLQKRFNELAPQALISEGYGITECSPVISVGRPDALKPGSIGQPLDGIDILVVDPETHKPLPTGETGMLLVHGPNVFSGYLGYDDPQPFLEHDGRQWYITGDLVSVDEDRHIFFQGRLKRFIKSGGEMISLPALEDTIVAKHPPDDKGPCVAVEGIELGEGERCITLFSRIEVPLEEANQLLRDAGHRGIMRIDEVIRLEAIPVLGTGKTDYKKLRAMIEENHK